MFRHPKYYKELRKRNKSDQVISETKPTGDGERAPGQGLKVSSCKHQAPSIKLSNQPDQLTSDKHPNHNHKRQATSLKLQAH